LHVHTPLAGGATDGAPAFKGEGQEEEQEKKRPTNTYKKRPTDAYKRDLLGDKRDLLGDKRDLLGEGQEEAQEDGQGRGSIRGGRERERERESFIRKGKTPSLMPTGLAPGSWMA